jgi:adenylate cyclase
VTSETHIGENPHEAVWRDVLLHGHRGRFAFLPSDPRCMMCLQPFQGLGGRFLRTFTGYRPSRMSPNVCHVCEDVLPAGGAEVDTAVLFADIRGSTTIAEQMGASEYAALLDRFYRASSHVMVTEQQGWIDKFVGDELMALYIPSMGSDYRRRAVMSGIGLLQAVGYVHGQQPWLPLAVGIHAGPTFVGTVGAAGSTSVTALGDTVNAAARIQSQAAAGELLISEELYDAIIESTYPGAERRTLTLRGREMPMDVRVLRPLEES